MLIYLKKIVMPFLVLELFFFSIYFKVLLREFTNWLLFSTLLIHYMSQTCQALLSSGLKIFSCRIQLLKVLSCHKLKTFDFVQFSYQEFNIGMLYIFSRISFSHILPGDLNRYNFCICNNFRCKDIYFTTCYFLELWKLVFSSMVLFQKVISSPQFRKF